MSPLGLHARCSLAWGDPLIRSACLAHHKHPKFEVILCTKFCKVSKFTQVQKRSSLHKLQEFCTSTLPSVSHDLLAVLQTTETLMRQNYSLQPLQRSASGPAPPVELQHPFLAAGSGSSSVPLPQPSLQQQQQQKQARQLDPASSYSLQPRVSRPAYPPVSTLRGQHFDSFGPGQHPVSLSERGACLDGGHHMEQVVSEPTYQSVAGAEGMPDSFTGYPVTGVLGQAENPMFAHGHSATEARVLRDWQDAGALRDFQASLARSLSYDQSGLLLQVGDSCSTCCRPCCNSARLLRY